MTKICKFCELEKDIKEFGKQDAQRRRNHCQKCHRLLVRKRSLPIMNDYEKAVFMITEYQVERYTAWELAFLLDTNEKSIINYLKTVQVYDFSYRLCTQCNQIKPISEYSKSRSRCKLCDRKHHIEYYTNNKEKVLRQKRTYNKLNCDKIRKYYSNYYRVNKDWFKEYHQRPEVRIKDRERSRIQSSRRRAIKNQAMPDWADEKKIEEIHRRAHNLTIQTGIQYNVDHIIPLQHELVCGLHVENNLQILTQEENISKNNKFEPIIESFFS